MRIAQRIGIHSEVANNKCAPFEAEMRRRLWWALVIFDSRISDMAGNKAAVPTVPIWDCQRPTNVDDSQLWPEMQTPPTAASRPSDAIFVAVRTEIEDFVRHSSFYLDFFNPALISMAKLPPGEDMSTFENHLEDKYITHCNLENPVHFMTVWTTRGLLAKYHLLQYYASHSSSPELPTDQYRDGAVSFCLRMVQADTALMQSPLVGAYHWLVNFSFPFPAYIHMLQEMRRRPMSVNVRPCWEAMSDNYEARFLNVEAEVDLFHKLIAKLIVRTWVDSLAVNQRQDEPALPPRIVSHIARKLGITDLSHIEGLQATRTIESVTAGDTVDAPLAHPISESTNEPLLWQSLDGFYDVSQYAVDLDLEDFHWNAFDMNSMLTTA